MYEIIYSIKASKQLRKLDKAVRERIYAVLNRIKIRPYSFITKLVGDPGYKLRIGNYRIIMDMDNGRLIILIIQIGHRKNIYKKS